VAFCLVGDVEDVLGLVKEEVVIEMELLGRWLEKLPTVGLRGGTGVG
jgi:hypothetical protein